MADLEQLMALKQQADGHSLRDEAGGEKSDIFSLGVVLYELLTGATPIDTRTLYEAGLEEMRRRARLQEQQRLEDEIRDSGALEGER